MREHKDPCNGKKMWSASVVAHPDKLLDSGYKECLKKRLKEECIRSYIENVEDSLVYNCRDVGMGRIEYSVKMESLLELKKTNKALRQELGEMISLYRELKSRLS